MAKFARSTAAAPIVDETEARIDNANREAAAEVAADLNHLPIEAPAPEQPTAPQPVAPVKPKRIRIRNRSKKHLAVLAAAPGLAPKPAAAPSAGGYDVIVRFAQARGELGQLVRAIGAVIR